jgi:hypothetical protein
MDCLPAQLAWKAFLRVWEEWEAPNRLAITWSFVLLGEAVFEEDDDPQTSTATWWILVPKATSRHPKELPPLLPLVRKMPKAF